MAGRTREPATARVTVNRYWQSLFGAGSVKTAEDFGMQGERPAQLDLLDFLAADFMDHGWDVKRLIQLIVTSRTYRADFPVSARNCTKPIPRTNCSHADLASECQVSCSAIKP